MATHSPKIFFIDTGTVAEKDIHLSKEEYDKLPEIAKNVIEASGIPLAMSASFPEEEFSVVTATIDEPQNAAAAPPLVIMYCI